MERDRAIQEIRTLAGDTSGEIPRDRIRAWMSSDDPDVQGAIYGLLRSSPRLRISPALERDERFAFFHAYLERGLIGKFEPSLTKHGAAWEIAGWVSGLFRGKATPDPELEQLRDWLATLYRNGSPEVRETLINGALEHLFEDAAIKKFFKGWQKDPVLATAFKEASLWASKGGDSPLVGRGTRSRK